VAAPIKGVATVAAQERVNILLVDDQPAKLLSYETILGELGETLIKANSGRSALEMLLKHDVAVILIDVCMPELDGFELAQMIRQHPRFQTTAIIFVSAVQVTDLDLLRGYKQGAVDYVPVPIAPELLRAKVQVFADLYRKTRQLEQFNAELEQRVAERTAELAHANEELARHNEELERRVEARTREHEAALNRVHQMQKLESLGQLTGGVAHDFNNLLMAVLGQLELLEKYLPDDAKIRRLLAGAVQGAERGASLTKRMLAFARQQDLKVETIDLRRLIENMLDMLSRSLGPSYEIALDFDLRGQTIKTDSNQLELAVLNLVLNARDAMPDNGKIIIAAHYQTLDSPSFPEARNTEYICVSVTDGGGGMDETVLKRAAEPFYTTKPVGKGTGLGLSMVDGLVAQCGGFMRIDSRPGIGTTVKLYFPAEAPILLPAANDAVPPTSRLNRSLRVLLVDDDQLVRDSTAAMLEDLGHCPVPAISGAEALALLNSGIAVDCAIMDYAMPGMTGVELAASIRRNWSHLPTILATGYAEAVETNTAIDEYLAKPYRLSALSDALDKIFDGAATDVTALSGGARL
jgi:signal transduction histidine kinase